MAGRGATSGPENSIVTGRRARTGFATSAATNSSGTGALSLSLSPPRKSDVFESATAVTASTAAPATPSQIRRLVLWTGAVLLCCMARSVGPRLPGSRSRCDGLPIAGGEPSSPATGCDASADRVGVASQRLAAAPGGDQRDDRGSPEHRGEPVRLAQRAPADAADHAGDAVTEHGVERLATAAQAAREVARDDRDARRVLGGESDRVEALRRDEDGERPRERRDHREPECRRESGNDEPRVHRPARQPAALEPEPRDLGGDADRPQHADVALGEAERR